MIANVRRFAIGAGSKTSSDRGAEASTVHAMPKAPWVVLLVSSTALARPHTDANGNLLRDAHSCGPPTIKQPVPGAALFSAPAANAPRTIYLNKNGGTSNITNGMTAAATHT